MTEPRPPERVAVVERRGQFLLCSICQTPVEQDEGAPCRGCGRELVYPDSNVQLGEPGFAGTCLFLFQDKPHRCPSCYVCARQLVRWRRYRLHWCSRCRYLWGGLLDAR